ncbi:MAG: hypothetical protein IJY08_04065 [Clostridia bacterium]|nr:hypothetical protein [Clostridia bacterium]
MTDSWELISPCQFCLGSNYLSTGNIYQPYNDRCKFYQVIFKANTKLKALEWDKGISKVEDEQALLRSLLTINSLPDAKFHLDDEDDDTFGKHGIGTHRLQFYHLQLLRGAQHHSVNTDPKYYLLFRKDVL